jgi:hypothetical protein
MGEKGVTGAACTAGSAAREGKRDQARHEAASGLKPFG